VQGSQTLRIVALLPWFSSIGFLEVMQAKEVAMAYFKKSK
jgi:hypothetical protein